VARSRETYRKWALGTFVLLFASLAALAIALSIILIYSVLTVGSITFLAGLAVLTVFLGALASYLSYEWIRTIPEDLVKKAEDFINIIRQKVGETKSEAPTPKTEHCIKAFLALQKEQPFSSMKDDELIQTVQAIMDSFISTNLVTFEYMNDDATAYFWMTVSAISKTIFSQLETLKETHDESGIIFNFDGEQGALVCKTENNIEPSVCLNLALQQTLKQTLMRTGNAPNAMNMAKLILNLETTIEQFFKGLTEVSMPGSDNAKWDWEIELPSILGWYIDIQMSAPHFLIYTPGYVPGHKPIDFTSFFRLYHFFATYEIFDVLNQLLGDEKFKGHAYIIYEIFNKNDDKDTRTLYTALNDGFDSYEETNTYNLEGLAEFLDKWERAESFDAWKHDKELQRLLHNREVNTNNLDGSVEILHTSKTTEMHTEQALNDSIPMTQRHSQHSSPKNTNTILQTLQTGRKEQQEIMKNDKDYDHNSDSSSSTTNSTMTHSTSPDHEIRSHTPDSMLSSDLERDTDSTYNMTHGSQLNTTTSASQNKENEGEKLYFIMRRD